MQNCSSNEVSIIVAYTTVTNNGYAFPFGIYEDDTLVGFVETGDVDGEELIAVLKL